MEFRKAVRKLAKARIALAGPSGSGKTWGALMLASGLGGSVCVIDTEKGSASLYAGLDGMPDFDVLELDAPYSPERFIEALAAAAKGGYAVTIIDGITPEWSGIGGCLEINEHLAQARFKGNTWSAWNETTPRHRRFIDAMLAHPGHLIATMRSKTETAQQEVNGRKQVVKLGMKSEQRDGIEYEFTAVLDVSHGGHYISASKDRTRIWDSRVDPAPLSVSDGEALRDWLNSGVAPAPFDLQTMIERIQAAPSPDDLQVVYQDASAQAKERNDAASFAEIKKATLARKAQLEAA